MLEFFIKIINRFKLNLRKYSFFLYFYEIYLDYKFKVPRSINLEKLLVGKKSLILILYHGIGDIIYAHNFILSLIDITKKNKVKLSIITLGLENLSNKSLYDFIKLNYPNLDIKHNQSIKEIRYWKNIPILSKDKNDLYMPLLYNNFELFYNREQSIFKYYNINYKKKYNDENLIKEKKTFVLHLNSRSANYFYRYSNELIDIFDLYNFDFWVIATLDERFQFVNKSRINFLDPSFLTIEQISQFLNDKILIAVNSFTWALSYIFNLNIIAIPFVNMDEDKLIRDNAILMSIKKNKKFKKNIVFKDYYLDHNNYIHHKPNNIIKVINDLRL